MKYSTVFNRGYLIGFLLLFLSYFITAKLGLQLNAVSGFATLVWPPTGISLAVLFLFGFRFWPAVTLGAFLVNFFSGASIFVSLGIALGNTLEALTGSYLLRKFGFNPSLNRLSEAFKLILLGAVLSTLISATIGTFSLTIGRIIGSEQFYHTWLAWWVGDALGNLVVAPLLFIWFGNFVNRKIFRSAPSFVEFTAAFLVLVISANIAFNGFLGIFQTPTPIAYIVLPALTWIAIRFTQAGTTLAIFILASIAIWGTIHGKGMFARDNLSESLLILQGFIGVQACMYLILSSVVEESKALASKKDEFIGMASHELKTPVTTIKAYTQILSNSFAQKPKPAQVLEKMNKEVNKLIKLINDLLDFNRVGLGKLELQPEEFELNSLVREIREELQVTNLKHQILFYPKGKIQILADRYRIGQVISNLLSNAIKFSPERRKVLITVSKDQEFAQVSVKDWGTGIDERYQREVFDRFFQTKVSTDRFYPGLGLGLYISSQIIKLHGGKIWLKSKLNKGSIFSFSLPLQTKI